jgi:hypothetical protein
MIAPVVEALRLRIERRAARKLGKSGGVQQRPPSHVPQATGHDLAPVPPIPLHNGGQKP